MIIYLLIDWLEHISSTIEQIDIAMEQMIL